MTHRDVDLFAGDCIDANRYTIIMADFIALQRYHDFLGTRSGSFLKRIGIKTSNDIPHNLAPIYSAI